jgi:hypothetical protein
MYKTGTLHFFTFKRAVPECALGAEGAAVIVDAMVFSTPETQTTMTCFARRKGERTCIAHEKCARLRRVACFRALAAL